MKRQFLHLAAMSSMAFALNSSAAVLYVDLNCTNPLPPYAGGPPPQQTFRTL